MKIIKVCCAIIFDGSKILAVQRGPNTSHPFQWEFPGGKIHLGETEEQCIIREIQEELKVNVEVLTKLESVEFDYGIKLIHLIPLVCIITSGEIILTEHLAMQWFVLSEWNLFNWAEADRQLIKENLVKLKQLLPSKDN